MLLATTKLAIETGGGCDSDLGVYRVRRGNAAARPVVGAGVGNSQRRRIRKQLGLPINSRLSPKDALAFRAFEDTDIKLKKSFPTMSDTQRQSMAREVLRDKGVIAKRKKPAQS